MVSLEGMVSGISQLVRTTAESVADLYLNVRLSRLLLSAPMLAYCGGESTPNYESCTVETQAEDCSNDRRCVAGECVTVGDDDDICEGILCELTGKIAFSGELGGTEPTDDSRDLFIINPPNKSLIQLEDTTTQARFPSFSPDGSQVAYYSISGGGELGFPWSDIYITNTSGSLVRNITLNEGSTISSNSPTWFPNGQDIAYVRREHVQNMGDLNRGIWRVNIDGTRESEILSTEMYISGLDVSPEGNRLLYSDNDLHLLSLASGEVRNLTNTPDFREEAPEWCGLEDGSEVIVYAANQGDYTPYQIQKMFLDTLMIVSLTSDPEHDYHSPSCAPDTDHIAYTQRQRDRTSILIMDKKGEHKTLLFSTEGDTLYDLGGLSWGP